MKAMRRGVEARAEERERTTVGLRNCAGRCWTRAAALESCEALGRGIYQ